MSDVGLDDETTVISNIIWALSMRFYILRNQVVVPASSAKEFGEWVETADRVVDHTRVADIEVSTVFLGIDHQFFAGPLSCLKRWCLRRSGSTCRRCSTWDEAVAQHEEILSEVLNRVYGYYKPG
ncbi:MAG: hypothetical protein R3B95_02935 [Nitrospirales bacterium]|nr:hypothetical protein [Nitrospirales bacterium]